jgi:glycosyltransferase involved in cell wall biosynthesis
MEGISICYTLKNRAHLLKWSLESLARQDTDLDIEVCIADGGSTDNLLSLIDRYSERFRFVYAVSDRSKAYVPVLTNNPGADLNAMIQYMPTYDTVLKVDPETILKDDWIIKEIHYRVQKDPSKCFSARTHFTVGDDWYTSYEDIVSQHEKHYLFAEGGPFSRSKFYFCCGFSRTSFITMGGIDERFCRGDGYEDTCFREHWKNVHGEYEYEITGQAIHLWHPPTPNHSDSLTELNRRLFEQLKENHMGNIEVSDEGVKHLPWANAEMLSCIYTIKDGSVVKSFKVTDNAKELDLPF